MFGKKKQSKQQQDTSIEVVATQEGYYGEALKAPGQAFFIEKPQHFSKKWMAKVEGEVADLIEHQAEEKKEHEEHSDGVTGNAVAEDAVFSKKRDEQAAANELLAKAHEVKAAEEKTAAAKSAKVDKHGKKVTGDQDVL